jgi:hypothetical protein
MATRTFPARSLSPPSLLSLINHYQGRQRRQNGVLTSHFRSSPLHIFDEPHENDMPLLESSQASDRLFAFCSFSSLRKCRTEQSTVAYMPRRLVNSDLTRKTTASPQSASPSLWAFNDRHATLLKDTFQCGYCASNMCIFSAIWLALRLPREGIAALHGSSIVTTLCTNE